MLIIKLPKIKKKKINKRFKSPKNKTKSRKVKSLNNQLRNHSRVKYQALRSKGFAHQIFEVESEYPQESLPKTYVHSNKKVRLTREKTIVV